ncbi:MAG: stage II sporulation protein R [Clostridiales bacterium]|jgi:stage II sporulation protein R|nr:stage II sporulation protein R [Clostridiales bacterium]
MKKVGICAAAAVFFAAGVIFCGCAKHTINEEQRLIRIHIRANGDGAGDQAVKLKVRETLSDYLETELADVSDFETAYAMLAERLDVLRRKADATLAAEGYFYGARVRLCNEFFPTRGYENVVVESGYYDALIVELGEGKGDNWWCVIYPPLCYLKAEGEGKIEYRSYIAEIIKKYFGKQ